MTFVSFVFEPEALPHETASLAYLNPNLADLNFLESTHIRFVRVT